MSSQINCLDYVPAQRALHLIGFENLIGGPNTDLASAARSVERYSDLSEYEKPDHLIIGVNPALAVDAHFLGDLLRPEAHCVEPAHRVPVLAFREQEFEVRRVAAPSVDCGPPTTRRALPLEEDAHPVLEHRRRKHQ